MGKEPETIKPRLLNSAEVKYMTGLKNTTLYDLMRKGAFPRPVKQGNKSLWWEHEVVDYMKSLPRVTM